jgi:hypothetical protein
MNGPPAVGQEMLSQVLAGWHTHLDYLAELLAEHPTDWANWPIDRWAEHRERYATRFAA